MSVEEQIRSEMWDVGLSVDPDTASALARVESGVRRQRTRRHVVLATAAAVTAVAGAMLAGGSLGWLTGQGDLQPIEQPSKWDGDWALVEDPDLQAANGLSAVVSVDGRLVAVGHGETPILTSTDGIDWTPAGTAEAWLSGVIRGGPGALAFGGTGSTSDEDDRAVLWTSPDGLTWTPASALDGSFDAPISGISDIVVGGPGYVAVGTYDNTPAVWSSPDGVEWTRAGPLTSRSGWLDTVTQNGEELIATGMVDLDSTAATDPEHGPAVWTSVDGTSWSRAAHDAVGVDANSDSWVEDVIAAGPGLVAVGTDGSRDRAIVWTSPDGETWTRVPEGQHGLDGQVNTVIEAGGEFVAVGQRPGDPDNDRIVFTNGQTWPDAAVWTSVDGLAWHNVTDESLGGEKGQVIDDIIQTDSGLLAVGTTDWDQTIVTNWSAAVWVMDKP